MRAQLASSLESINTQIASVSGQLDIWRAKRDEQKRFYANKLSYEDVKKKEIPKGSICALFRKPGEQNTVREGTKRFPIHWCIHDAIRNNFWDRWWMVFDAPPCNNHEVPMYFLKKLYCEFVLGEIPNYFDMLDSQGRGGGSSFERPGARRDPNVVRAPVVHPQREHVIIPSVVKEHVEASTLGTINALTQTLIHSTSPLVTD